jgi:Tfp pilus assembly protein FimV
MKKNQILCFIIVFIISFAKFSLSEPFVVLEYRGSSDRSSFISDNLFLQDLNYSTKHLVLKNETLSDIMLNYYGSSSFNNKILSLAIVTYNKKAFVRNNPNYLYSGKKLYLPSVNEIKNLIIKKDKSLMKKEKNNSSMTSQIYFFGG